MPGANAIWNTNGQVLVSDVAARDVQAATSLACRVAPAKQSLGALRATGEGSGDAEAAKSESLNGAANRNRTTAANASPRPFRIMHLKWLTRMVVCLLGNDGGVMDQLRNYGDERQTSSCVYCGDNTGTRDHVPSKVFLDDPYPSNLPIVPACKRCNNSFSKDEEYVACLVECALVGSVNRTRVQRAKIRRILEERPALASRLIQAREATGDGVSFRVEAGRVKNVALKLARGHAVFELNEPQRHEPSHLYLFPFSAMTPNVRARFEAVPRSSIWPEAGSRAMHRLVVTDPGASTWIVVQPGRYRYLASVGDGVIIRLVISEYLGCEVIWDRN